MATANVPGRLLLTMPDCHVECAGNEYHGTLALEYLAAAPAGQLALRVGAFETPVPATQPIVHHRAQGIYTIPGLPAPATLSVPLVAPNAAARVVLDAFSVLLARYGVVHEAEGGLRGHCMADDAECGSPLVDETDALVVVALSGSIVVQKDDHGHEQPIVLCHPPAIPELHVRALLPEETAALLRSAHALSRGIVLATTTLAAGMALASSAFVARTAPNATPVVFSAATRRNVEHAHALSGAAVAASAHTTELILHVVDHTTAYVAPGPRSPPPSAPPTGIAALAPSAGLVLATLARSGAHLLTEGTRALADGLHHRYGADVGDTARLGSETARNIGTVYGDACALGPHALLVRVGQRVVAARLAVFFSPEALPSPPPSPPPS